MEWQDVLVKWPVKLFNLWWRAYGFVLALLIMVTVTIGAISLVLYWGFGVRWGW